MDPQVMACCDETTAVGTVEGECTLQDQIKDDFHEVLLAYMETLKKLEAAEKEARRCESLELEMKELRQKNRKLKLEKESLEHDLHLAFEEADSLEHIVHTLQQRCVDAEKLNETLRNEVEQACERVSEYKDFAKTLNEQIEMARTEERVRMSAELSEMERLKDHVKALESDKDETQNEIKHLKEKLQGQGAKSSVTAERSSSISSMDSQRMWQTVKSYCSNTSQSSGRPPRPLLRPQQQDDDDDSEPEELGPYGEKKPSCHATYGLCDSSLLKNGRAAPLMRARSGTDIRFGAKDPTAAPSFRSLPGVTTTFEKRRIKSDSTRRKRRASKTPTTNEVLSRGLEIVQASNTKKMPSYPSLDVLLDKEQKGDSVTVRALKKQIRACEKKNAGRMRAKAA